ncbi:hypothetical protein CQ018_10015 [Arthrobacter sp. MYb227]|uniref:hypothetical protein n=1 Tax=Arthrobacter sp. MYb227 TaxID=1848601 RepID=UPI000CFB4489|nr:hypothetical protein [Arthrobacter sp. MYb227]PQZ92811.1 hypothetical protein CQ018_10015 [Arthrobacter sp. MYb227]
MITGNPAGQVRTTDSKAAPKRLFWVLTIIPLLVFVLCCALYLMSRSELPASIAIHVGSDGFGFGSMQSTALIQLGLGLLMLGFGTRYTLDRLKIGYWYMAEKTVPASFISIGYASLVSLLTLILGVWGEQGEAAQESAFTRSILIFAVTLILSMGIHAVVLPRIRNFE